MTTQSIGLKLLNSIDPSLILLNHAENQQLHIRGLRILQMIQISQDHSKGTTQSREVGGMTSIILAPATKS